MKDEKMQGGMSANILISKILKNAVCIILCAMSLLPFWIMIVNATRASVDIQSSFSMVPSSRLVENYQKLIYQCNANVPLYKYLINSCIIAVGFTALSLYFSSLTAYSVSVYKYKGVKQIYAFILAIMMIPTQVSSIGFYRMCFQWGLGNNYIPLIVTGIAAPATVFFMKQFMESALPLEIIDAARIDGSKELHTFNTIAIPLLKPAIATQAIFQFIGSWNNFYTPSMILTDQKKYTLPMFVQLLRGERFRSDYGIIYVGLCITIIPIFVIYFTLSKYIIAGVALGGVKE